MKRNKERLKYILTSLLKGYKSTSPSRIQKMMMCVGEAERGRDSLGSCFHALPANSSEVTLGGRQDKSFYADGAKQPSTPQHTYCIQTGNLPDRDGPCSAYLVSDRNLCGLA